MKIIQHLYIIAILAVLSFFDLSFLPDGFYEEIQFLVGISIIGFIILFSKLYYNIWLAKMNFALPILIMLVGWFISIVVCKLVHNQSYILTLFAGRLLLYYSLYFFLHLFRLTEEYIVKVLTIVGFIAMGLFFLQYIIYPTIIVNSKIMVDRGTLRIFASGLPATIFVFFVYLDKFLKKQEIGSLLIVLLSYSVFILQGTRQVIFGLALIAILNVIFSKQIKSKFAIGTLFVLSFGCVFFIFQDLFNELFNVTSSQASSQASTPNVRVLSAYYYLTEFQKDIFTYLFGNGTPHGSSSYGAAVEYQREYNGFYLSDIGIIGDYVQYGLVFIIGGIVMIFKAIFTKVSTGTKKYKNYIYFLLLTILTTRGFLGNAEIIMVTILYLIDLDKQKQYYRLIKNKIRTNADNKSSEISFG